VCFVLESLPSCLLASTSPYALQYSTLTFLVLAYHCVVPIDMYEKIWYKEHY